MFASGSIVPSLMNRSDGGKNRPNMSQIGMAGLDRVLHAMGVDISRMKAEECRSKLWECSIVMQQLNEMESTCRQHGVILLYQPKSPPKFNWCEHFFRSDKYRLQNQFDVAAQRDQHEAFERRFSPNSLLSDREAHRLFVDWKELTYTYIDYFIYDGSKNLNEQEARAAQIEGLPRRLSGTSPRLLSDLAQQAHESNWILIRGKHYPLQPQQWQPRADWLERLRAVEPQTGANS